MSEVDRNEMVATALSGGREDVTLRFMAHGEIEEDAIRWMSNMRRQYAEMAREISLRLPTTRTLAIALDKLEEASFYTMAAAARACGKPVWYDDLEDEPGELNATGHHHR